MTYRSSSMANEIILVVEDSSEGGYEAKALSHPIFTEADTLEDLRAMPCSATLKTADVHRSSACILSKKK